MMPLPAIAGYAKCVGEFVAGRPEYPSDILRDLPAADTIIELGAGTGKFTDLLAQTGKHIIAVEPIPEMAARIQRGENISVAIGKAEDIPATDQAAGLVCCATSFHWFDYAKATSEILRVLVPNGTLALIWNVMETRTPWVAQFSRLLDSYAGDSPRQARGKWRVIFNDPRFQHQATRSYPFSQSMPVSGIFDRALSASFIAMLPLDEQQIVRTKVARIVENEPSLRSTVPIQFPYVTQVHVFGVRVANAPTVTSY